MVASGDKTMSNDDGQDCTTDRSTLSKIFCQRSCSNGRNELTLFGAGIYERVIWRSPVNVQR